MWTTPTPLAAQVADDPEQLVDLRVGQCRGRLVHDQDGGIERQRLRDLDHLLLGDLEIADAGLRVEPQMEAVDQLLRLAVESRVIEQEPGPAARLPAHEHVLGDREVRHQVQLLVDHADAEVERGPRVGDLDRLALEADLAAIGLVDAGQDLHEGRLAGAVLTDERVDLPRSQLEGRIDERADAREFLGDPGHLDERFVHRRSSQRATDEEGGAAASMRQAPPVVPGGLSGCGPTGRGRPGSPGC